MKKMLDQLVLDAQHELSQQHCGISMCEAGKIGMTSTLAKHAEGREYIARKARVAFLRNESVDDVILSLKSESEKLTRIEESELGNTENWKAYILGGREMIEKIQQMCTHAK